MKSDRGTVIAINFAVTALRRDWSAKALRIWVPVRRDNGHLRKDNVGLSTARAGRGQLASRAAILFWVLVSSQGLGATPHILELAPLDVSGFHEQGCSSTFQPRVPVARCIFAEPSLNGCKRVRGVAKRLWRGTESAKETASHSLAIAKPRLARYFLDW
jgi:hypothetical protein